MTIKDLIKIECIKQGKNLSYIAREIGITRNNYYFHLNNLNQEIIKKSEIILNLESGYFVNQLKNN